MAMTVRLDAEHDRMLTELAQRWGVSKNEAIARAVEDAVSGATRHAHVLALTQEAQVEWADTLDRLGRE